MNPWAESQKAAVVDCNYEQRFFGVYLSFLKFESTKWNQLSGVKICYDVRKSDFLVQMRASFDVIGVLRSLHAGYPGTPCFSDSVRSAFPTTYFGRIPDFISLEPVKSKTIESPTLFLPKTFSRAALQIHPNRLRLGLHQLPVGLFSR